MAIKYNGRDLQKRIINGREVEKVMYNGVQIRPSSTPPVSDDYLCFTSLEADNTLSLNKYGDPREVSLEISWDKTNWIDYTIGTTIHFANSNDKLYWRNKSTGVTTFSDIISHYAFSTGKTFEVSGDVNYLLCKTSTNTLSIQHRRCFYRLFDGSKITTPPKLPATTLASFCYNHMFNNCSYLTESPELPATTLEPSCYSYMFSYCTSLLTAPELPATTLANSCYYWMFQWCTSLSEIPKLPAINIEFESYTSMFAGCSSIKLSDTQTGEYQTPYRIPTTGTLVYDPISIDDMFSGTGGTYTGTPIPDTTYYTSNTVV